MTAGWAIWRGAVSFGPTAHANLVALLRAAQASGDLDEEARVNVELAQEGFRAARAFVLAWRGLCDEETGLFPGGGDEVGADDDSAAGARLHLHLAAASPWSGRNCGSIAFATGRAGI